MNGLTASLWQRVALMSALAGLAALAVYGVVLPVLEIGSKPEPTPAVSTSDGTEKGGLEFRLVLRPGFDSEPEAATTLHPDVSAKGDFLGWFPETANMELEFQITQTEDPLAFERPSFSFPSIVERTTTRLVAFANAPFPFYGRNPRSNRPFSKHGGRYRDPRALIHIPKGFDIESPGVMVVFYHGHGATLRRDVYKRQQVPQQVSASGVNAVLVAPQFAVDARDSSAGKLWEKGGLRRFLDEVATQLAEEHGAPGARAVFARMPVIIVAYSGGFEPAAWSVSRGGLGDRLKGLVLLDALYGHVERFAHWIGSNRSAFLIDAYAGGSPARNSQRLKSLLRANDISYQSRLNGQLRPGSVTFLAATTSHRRYVNKAWTKSPIADVLRRLRHIIGKPPPHLAKIAATH